MDRAAVCGFSLVELMVAMTLGLVVMLMVSTAFLGLRELSQTQATLAHTQERLRFAVDSMTRDLRAAGTRATGVVDLEHGLVPAEPGQLEQSRFTVRKAGMNCLGETGPWVASVYSVAHGQLFCGNDATPAQNQPLVSGVQALRVLALDAQGQTDWSRPVALHIELEMQAARPGEPVRSMGFVVTLRNRVLAHYQGG